MVKNGNMRFLVIRAYIGRLNSISTFPVKASSGQDWQFHICTGGAYIGRSTGKSSLNRGL